MLSLALLAACGSHADDAAAPAGASAPPAAGDSGNPAADYNAASVKAESSIADCMKKAGFQYVAHPTRVDETDQRALYGAGGESKAGGESTTSAGCAPTAAQKYFGNGPSEGQQAAAAREYAAFQNDPQVVAAAQKYADCLRGKGYPVASASPGTIEQSVRGSYLDKVSQGGTPGTAAAKIGLTNEIKAALDDLGCRTDYAELARTKYAAVIQAGTGNG
jgi:hypothetical protein